MDHQKGLRALIGFVVGSLLGYGMNYLFLWVWNKAALWLDREPTPQTWTSGIGLAIIFGLVMAINMANPPFGD
jgi:predicted lysophospholipase L1 biosynthesis ABC-type transport system permease subunit